MIAAATKRLVFLMVAATFAVVTLTAGPATFGGRGTAEAAGQCASANEGRHVNQAFLSDVLRAMGIAPTARSVQALEDWVPLEGTRACYNPLATTQRMAGSTSFNSIGVQNYATRASGVSATARTLLNGRYAAIDEYLAGHSFKPSAIQSELRTWIGSPSYAAHLTNEWAALWKKSH